VGCMKMLVIGAGIAGLNCALRLLQQGHQVTVIERQRGPIDRVCGEGILPFGVDLLEELGLADTVRQAGFPFVGLSYHHGTRQVAGNFAPGQMGIGIERKCLDAILREACARESGYELKEGVRLKPGDDVGYDRVFAADGINSRWGAQRQIRQSSRLGVRFRVATCPGDRVQVHFFKGYEIYFTPTQKDTLSVACLVDPMKSGMGGSGLQSSCLAAFRQHFPELAEAPVTDLAARGPISTRVSGPHPDFHLLGDALVAFDPICGAGMSFALLCGKLAAAHCQDTEAYYADLKQPQRSIGCFTDALLFFRGGGWRTRLMLRQLALAPASFTRMITAHDGRHQFLDLGFPTLLPLLRPW